MTHSLPTTYEWIQSSSTKVSESYSGPDSVQSVSRHRHGHGMVPARSSPGPCFGYTFKWTPNLAHALVKEPETRYPVSSTTSKPALRRSSSSSLQSSSAKVSVIPRPRLSAKYATPQTWSWYVLPRVRPLGPCFGSNLGHALVKEPETRYLDSSTNVKTDAAMMMMMMMMILAENRHKKGQVGYFVVVARVQVLKVGTLRIPI